MDDSELNAQDRHDDALALVAQLSTASAAIDHVLTRIRTSPEVGYYMGYGTESFFRLCAAYAEIHGELPVATRERFHPLKPRDPTKALNAQIEELKERLSGIAGHSCCDDDPATFGPENLTAEDLVKRVQELLGLHSAAPARCVREIAALYTAQDLPINLVLSPA